MRFVPSGDSAWRCELVDEECQALAAEAVKALGENPTHEQVAAASVSFKDPEKGHVFWRYFAGATRYDLDDAELQPYLDRDEKPETWHFRRLSLEERETIGQLDRTGRSEQALALAFSSCVTALEMPSGPAGEKLAAAISALPKTGRTAKQRAQLLKLVEDYSAISIVEVGGAVCQGAQDLTSAEKNP